MWYCFDDITVTEIVAATAGAPGVQRQVGGQVTTTAQSAVSRKTVRRLSLYRRILAGVRESGTADVYSHQLAHLAGVSATQVRRDFMVIGYSGSPNRGYQVDTCLAAIEDLLDGTTRQEVALVGVGRLGRSLLAHFSGQRPLLRVSVGFDTDESLVGASLDGCTIFGMEAMEQVVAEKGIRIAILAVPQEMAQPAADALARAGIRSIVDFTAIPVKVPDEVFVDHMDITSALESAAFFAREERPAKTGADRGADEVSETSEAH